MCFTALKCYGLQCALILFTECIQHNFVLSRCVFVSRVFCKPVCLFVYRLCYWYCGGCCCCCSSSDAADVHSLHTVCFFTFRSFHLIGTASVWSFSFTLLASDAFVSFFHSFHHHIACTSFCLISFTIRSSFLAAQIHLYILYACTVNRIPLPLSSSKPPFHLAWFAPRSLPCLTWKSGIHCLRYIIENK